MTSFGYRLNPRYAIKECSSCGTLYTRDCSCSKGSVEDKILVPKPPKNYARCAKCGHPVNGPYCQGCTLLREKLEEDLVTYFQNFQNTFESSNDSTNVVNAPQEPFVVKKDHGVNPSHIDECELISIFNSGIRENLSTTCVNLPIEDDHSPLLAYVVWIFLAYLTYPIIPHYLHPFGNEDTIFDPDITINRVYSFKPGLSHRCGAFKKFNTH
nr:hypothetical protein [Tanacetum cinerariifolium]